MTTATITTMTITMGQTNTAIPITMNTPMATFMITAMEKIMKGMTILTNTESMTMTIRIMEKAIITIPIKIVNPVGSDK